MDVGHPGTGTLIAMEECKNYHFMSIILVWKEIESEKDKERQNHHCWLTEVKRFLWIV